MTKEYRAKVFKSGNSVALRLPKALGLREGEEMILREEAHGFTFEPAPTERKKIDLTGIYGSVPGIKLMTSEDREFEASSRPWDDSAWPRWSDKQ
jgi:antitoxin VapB